MSVKKEQQIYLEIGNIVREFCTNNGFESWVNNNNLLQWGQPTFQSLPNKAILMNFFDGSKYGWVSTKYKWDKENNVGGMEISNYRKIVMTFTFFVDPKMLLKSIKDNEVYIAGEDIANALRAYFLSDLGLKELHSVGYSILDTSIIRNAVTTTDENKYARTSNFDITLTTFDSINISSDFVSYEQQKEDFENNKTLTKTSIIGK